MPDVKPVLEAVPDPVPGVPELTAKEKRALREEARREFKASEKARIAATSTAGKKAAPAEGAAPSAAASPAAPPLVAPDRTDAERAKDAAVFLRGVVWPFLALVAGLFGFHLDALTEPAAAEDGRAWVPLARRYRVIDALFTWGSAPARLVARVRELGSRRPKPPEVKP